MRSRRLAVRRWKQTLTMAQIALQILMNKQSYSRLLSSNELDACRHALYSRCIGNWWLSFNNSALGQQKVQLRHDAVALAAIVAVTVSDYEDGRISLMELKVA